MSSRKKRSSRTSDVSSQFRIEQVALYALLTSPFVTTKTASNLGPVKNQRIHSPKHLPSLRFQRNRQTPSAFTPRMPIASRNRTRLQASPLESSSKQPFASPRAHSVVSNETSNEQSSTRGHETTINANSDSSSPVPLERLLHVLPTHGHTLANDESSPSKQREHALSSYRLRTLSRSLDSKPHFVQITR